MHNKFSFSIIGKDEGKRLDLFLTKKLGREGLSRSVIQKYIEGDANLILVNSQKKKAHYRIKEGDLIEVQIPEPSKTDLTPLAIQLDILFEDDDILVINKPPGIPTHPSAGHKNDTLVNALIHYFGNTQNLSNIGGELRPGIVHRLDKDTAGVLLIAKNNITHTQISDAFAKKEVEKIYDAIVKGVIIPKEGTIERSIKRSERNRKKFRTGENGKSAVTHYHVIDSKSDTTWVQFFPKTGRTHQLRVHAASMGHPIIGDPLYARKSHPVEFMALFAKELEITHPSTQERMKFKAPYPKHFIELGKTLGYNIS
ncbi:MAG: RluA family pseudouridine synthase [Spirochaetota bacterium]|nr:MAG: RluA family pseudouridine synthase [Spirochaetota bacterium]